MSEWQEVKIGDLSVTAAESFRRLELSFAIQVVKFVFEKRLNKNSLLGDFISEIRTGKTPSKNEYKYYENKFISWFKPSEIGHKLYLEDSENHLSKHAVDSKQVTIFKPKTLLINCIGDIGRMGILNKESSSNQQLTGILFDEKVLPEYAFLYLLAYRSSFYEGILQTTLPIINQNKLKKLPFCLISLEEQKKLIDFIFFLLNVRSKDEIEIYQIDDEIKDVAIKLFLIAQTKEKVCKNSAFQKSHLKNLRQQILQDAISGKLTADWRTENPDVEPASELLKKIKVEKEKLIAEKKIRKEKSLPKIEEDEMPFKLPKGWEWCRLGEITTYGTSKKIEPKDISDDVWVLDLEDIEKESSRIINYEIYKNRKSNSTKSIFKKGDVLYSKLRPYLDKVVVAPKDGICTTEILPLPVFGNMDSSFFMYAMKRKDFLRYADKKVKGMKMPRLGTEDGKRALFPLPPHAEQRAIVAKVEQLMGYVSQLEEKIAQNANNAETLMQAFLGEVFKK